MNQSIYFPGLVVSVLVGIVLGLFGLAGPILSLSIIFLIAGAWTIVFGLMAAHDQVVWMGWGAGIAILASSAVLPIQYAVGLILIVVIALIIFSVARSNRTRIKNPA